MLLHSFLKGNNKKNVKDAEKANKYNYSNLFPANISSVGMAKLECYRITSQYKSKNKHRNMTPALI